MHNKAAHLVDKLDRALAKTSRPVSLHEPYFAGNEWKYVKDCLDTGWGSSVGKYVDRFEADLAHFTGAKHAIVTSSGTTALHLAFIAAGVQANEEVLLPTLTFVGTANSIVHAGAVPHFVDVHPQTFAV